MPILYEGTNSQGRTVKKLVLLAEETQHESFSYLKKVYERNDILCCTECVDLDADEPLFYEVSRVEVAHPIWDGPYFSCTAMNGKVLHINRIYCPNCDIPISSRGLPIIMPGSYIHNLLPQLPREWIMVCKEIYEEAMKNWSQHNAHQLPPPY